MNIIQKLSELEEGQQVLITSLLFNNAQNKCKLISRDTTELNRPIAYFQFSDRFYLMAEGREDLEQYFQGKKRFSGIFAVWQHDLGSTTLIETT